LRFAMAAFIGRYPWENWISPVRAVDDDRSVLVHRGKFLTGRALGFARTALGAALGLGSVEGTLDPLMPCA